LKIEDLRAFGSSPFGLPIVVTGAYLLVAVGSRGHTQAFRTTLLAEEQTWLLVLCVRTSIRTTRTTICNNNNFINHFYNLNIKIILFVFFTTNVGSLATLSRRQSKDKRTAPSVTDRQFLELLMWQFFWNNLREFTIERPPPFIPVEFCRHNYKGVDKIPIEWTTVAVWVVNSLKSFRKNYHINNSKNYSYVTSGLRRIDVDRSYGKAYIHDSFVPCGWRLPSVVPCCDPRENKDKIITWK